MTAQDTAPSTTVESRQKLDVNKIISDTTTQTAEKFATLREERRYISNRISEIELELASEYRELGAELSRPASVYYPEGTGISVRSSPRIVLPPGARSIPYLRSSRGVPKKDLLEKRLTRIDGEIKKISDEVTRLSSIEETSTVIKSSLQEGMPSIGGQPSLQEELSSLQEEKEELEYRIDNYENEVKEYEEMQKERESVQQELETRITRRQALETEVRDLRYYLNVLDDAIAGLFVTSDHENQFRLWVSGTFALLVAVVIMGFFFIAFKERTVSVSIFSSDSGLQFVTLFSLIIAIILFGIINILEGRELAALLGGLSGYILGRSALAARQKAPEGTDATTGASASGAGVGS